MKNKAVSRNETLDLLKGFAMLMVIFCHALQRAWGGHGGYQNFTPIWNLVYDWHMPLFFMISGYLAAKSRSIGSFNFVRSKFFRLIYVWFIWRWLEWIFLRFDFSGLAHFTRNLPLDFWGNVKAFFVSPLRPLWFLPDLFLIFLLLCVCKWISCKKDWIMNAALAFSVGVSLVMFYYSRKAGAFYSYDLQFVGLFAFGFWFEKLCKKAEEKGYSKWNVATAFVTAFSLFYILIRNHFPLKNWSIFSYWCKAVVWMAALYFVFYALSRCNRLLWIRKALCFMGVHSLEFYTLQFLCLDCGWFIENRIIRWGFNFVSCMAICWLIIFVVDRYLPFVHKLLWGSFSFKKKSATPKQA